MPPLHLEIHLIKSLVDDENVTDDEFLQRKKMIEKFKRSMSFIFITYPQR
jgi:hypothetical protein